ncbi:MAG: hypothetical protein JW941_01520, partial [Candidatus Coatesbacteria bacterium]|nr:hypothetical protein [Candidatus Coatesbacteria bacterium]
KLPYKGQPEGEKKSMALYYLPDYDELCTIYSYSPKYFNLGYYDFPPSPGSQEEINFYENRDIRLMAGGAQVGGTWNSYNKPSQREEMTRHEAEYEPVDLVNMLDRKVDVKITGEDQQVYTMAGPFSTVALGQAAMVAKFRATAEVEALTTGEQVVPFDLSGIRTKPPTPMKISKVVDDRGLDILRIKTLDLIFPPLHIGQRISFTTEYEGYICSRMRTSDSFTSGNSTWYPNYGYLACATMDVVLGVPKPYKGLSVGAIKDSWSDENYTYTHWSSEECIKLAAVILGDYSVLEREFKRPDGSTFKFMFYYRPSMKYYPNPSDWVGFNERASSTGSGSNDWRTETNRYQVINFTVKDPDAVITEFESIFDWLQALYVPFPYSKISPVMMPLFSFYGQGFPSMLTLDGTSFIAEGERAQYDFFFRYLADWGPRFWDHEAGHQYWGHVIGWYQPRDQWISEAFTEHQSAMYVEASRGPERYKQCLDEWRFSAIKDDPEGSISLGGRRLGDAYVPMIYNKGPWFVHMIRKMVGDNAFQKFCRNLLTSMSWKNPTTCDVQEVLEQTLGKDNMLALFGKDNMQWFFDQWIYGTGIPSYEFGYKISGNTAKVKIKHVDAQFRTRIPVWVYDKSGNKYAVPILLTGEKPVEEFDLHLKGPAKKLELDEYGAVLTKKIKNVKYKKIKA